MPRIARSPHQIHRVREAILDAAVREFSQRGYGAVTMKDIAGAAGYTAPSLYNYFSSKEEIFAALFQRICDAFDGAFEAPTITGLSAEQRLELLVRRLLDVSHAHREAFAMFLDPQSGARLSDAMANQRIERFQEHLRRMAMWIGESPEVVGDRDPDTLAYLLWGILHAVQIRGLIEPTRPSTPEAEARVVVEFFLRGAAGLRRAA